MNKSQWKWCVLATAWSGKAVRLMLCAAIPEAMAIIASIVIHAIVNYSSRNASRISAPRSISGMLAARAGVQKFSTIAVNL
jgi:hypothetical protein